MRIEEYRAQLRDPAQRQQIKEENLAGTRQRAESEGGLQDLHRARRGSRGARPRPCREQAAFTNDRNAKVKAALAQPARTRAARGRRGWKPAEHGVIPALVHRWKPR